MMDGYNQYWTTWETKTTEIKLFLYAENRDPTFGLEYTSKEFQKLEEEANREYRDENL